MQDPYLRDTRHEVFEQLVAMRIGSRPRAHARARSKNYAYQNWSARS